MNLHPAMPEKQQSSNPDILGAHPFILVPSWKAAFLEQDAMTGAGTYIPLCLKNIYSESVILCISSYSAPSSLST